MREILFRGRDTDGVWHEGFYCVFSGKSHRIYTGYAETDCGDYYPDYFEVEPETVGQYIGVTDKNDKEIFEGDIVKSYNGHIGWVEFCSSTFVKRCRCHIFKNAIHGDDQIVIGNIYDNPELLRSDTE